jgi:hypothetical protein
LAEDIVASDPVPFSAALRFVEEVFGPLGEDAGAPLEDLVAAERRLGLGLPNALRELYLRTGRAAALHASHNTLVPLDRIDFADEHLIFYEENQGVVLWGIDRSRLSEPDPPVVQGQPPRDDGARWEFHPEFASVSAFLRAMSAWQAVQGGLPFVGVKEPFLGGDGALTETFGAPSFVESGMRVWTFEGGVVVKTEAEAVSMGTRSAELFVRGSARVGMTVDDWDYATLQDES